MKRVPLVATVIVLVACATMIGLGLWQLRRGGWKESLIETYAAARNLQPMAYPMSPDPKDLPLFRRASGQCLSVESWDTTSGRNLGGESGWIHVARCSTGVEGPGMSVVAGWSKATKSPAWRGGTVVGTIATDPETLIRLVSDTPLAPDLVAAAPPDIAEIPNNHFAYAVQWFLFAGAAGVIYLIALRRRAKP